MRVSVVAGLAGLVAQQPTSVDCTDALKFCPPPTETSCPLPRVMAAHQPFLVRPKTRSEGRHLHASFFPARRATPRGAGSSSKCHGWAWRRGERWRSFRRVHFPIGGQRISGCTEQHNACVRLNSVFLHDVICNAKVI